MVYYRRCCSLATFIHVGSVERPTHGQQPFSRYDDRLVREPSGSSCAGSKRSGCTFHSPISIANKAAERNFGGPFATVVHIDDCRNSRDGHLFRDFSRSITTS